jgi:choline dehydrogenase-like flavoprotein
MIPNEHSYCDIDPNAVDRWGIPVLRFHFRWNQHEIKQVNHMHDTFAALIETMGGKVLGAKRPKHDTDWISVPGTIIHESGTVRMGDDAKKSALNKFNQAHEVKNLFVMDAAPFVSQPDKNVTLSIVAFAWRASEYLAEEMRKGNV